jgi:kynureninase
VTHRYVEAQLDTWSSLGVEGHFRNLEDSPLVQWQLLSEQAACDMARLVGASSEEVAAMGALTSNLHLMLASFYTPSGNRNKIILDWKAFPSDHVSAYLSAPCTSVLCPVRQLILAVCYRISNQMAWAGS